MKQTFKALLITENKQQEYNHSIIDKKIEDLPKGDLLIQVNYSSLNYKDALSFSGNKGVTRNYPHTPGIDAAGVVMESTDKNFLVGDAVIVTGYDLGMNTTGGFAEYIRVPSEWAVPLPENLSLRESMIYGTAGFTAALSVDKLLKNGLQPEDGEILVTGASGGVGSLAISILNQLGFDVVAVTGKADAIERLLKLGANKIITRKEFEDSTNRALLPETWAGAVDTLGGDVLSNIIKSLKYNGSVACCGNITSGTLDTSIYPFILRGVSLLGIDSVQTDMKTRKRIWTSLANEWKPKHLEENIDEIKLADVPGKIQQIIEGSHIGRSIIHLSA